MVLVATCAAQVETVVHNFGQGDFDGVESFAGLVQDAAGNLYGTTNQGGIQTQGTVFELSPRVGGGWSETVLHSFGNGTDGKYPYAGLIFDSAGDLYGTTANGGIHVGGSCYLGCGAVFELSPREGGGWTETVLHSFGSGTDGARPYAGLLFDAAGNLYGTTYEGGIHNTCFYEGLTCGTVFEISPRQGGGWTETVLHSFGNGTDGANPQAGLIFDGAGNLYGTTGEGGTHQSYAVGGIAFELSPREGGGWQETVLYNFCNLAAGDGCSPAAALVFDGEGNLYGTTVSGGIHFDGTAFRLSPRQGGGWTETILHSFGRSTDGIYPNAGLIFDSAGNLYGTTADGGIHSCGGPGCGTVFKLTP